MMTSTMVHLSELIDSGLALIYPQQCHACEGQVESRHDGVACAACWNHTKLFDESATLCWKCGAFTDAVVRQEQSEDVRCRQCDDEEFNIARACGLYEGALRASILNLKREPHVPKRLAELMLATQQRQPLAGADLITPVPLHRERERERGFNQAAVLAHSLARQGGLPLNQHSLVRLVHTERHRAGMDAKARRKSVANAFETRRPDLIVRRRILLVDDVFTTGATVSACARVLKEAGAEAVFVLTVARA